MSKFIEIETVDRGQKYKNIINIEQIVYFNSGGLIVSNDDYLSISDKGYKDLKKFLMEREDEN